MLGWVPAPAYDSGEISIIEDYDWHTFEHDLNTTDLLVYVFRNNSEFGINQGTLIAWVDWFDLSETEVSVRAPSYPHLTFDEIRVQIWKIAEP